MALPDTTVLAGFSNPASADLRFDDPTYGLFDTGEFGGGATADISEYLTGTLTITRGRSHALDDFQPGTASFTVDDDDRTFDPDESSSPYYGTITTGKPLEIQAYGVTIFVGALGSNERTDEQSDATLAPFTAEDLFASLGRKSFTAWTTSSQLAGARIEAVLDRSEVGIPAELRSIDAGASTLQADSVSYDSNVLNYLQLVAKSDLGRLFVDRQGFLRYIDRLTVAASTPYGYIDDDYDDSADPQDYAEADRIRRRLSPRDHFNRVTVDREGGTAQTSALDDLTITDQGGIRTLSRTGLLLNDDDDSAEMADWLLSIFGVPQQRIYSLEIELTGLTTAQAQYWCAADIGHILDVGYTPNRVGDRVEHRVIIEQVVHSISKTSHKLTLGVSHSTAYLPFIFDDPVYGQFDGSGAFIF